MLNRSGSAHMVAAALITGFMPCVLAAPAAASAEPSVITLVERDTTDTTIGGDADNFGSVSTFANDVYDSSNAQKMGTVRGMCTRITPGVSSECVWTLSLAGGQIMASGPEYDKADSVAAITGGTGQFAGARGEVNIAPSASDGGTVALTYRLM